MRRGRAHRLAAWLLCLAASTVGCGGKRGDGAASDPTPALHAPPVVLISIDTLRSDRLPAYGYAAISTPAIDRLRADGILFERAYSPVPTTLAAHATMLTGLLPPQHGVRDNRGYALDSETPFLPSLLRRADYRTGAAVSSFVLRAETGLDRDFELFDDEVELAFDGDAQGQRAGSDTLERARRWLRAVGEEPLFLFLHLYEPHAPYAPPEPYASRYDSPYDGEIAAVDEVVGALIAELEEGGVYDRALVILTSDHGEGLGDHVEQEHGIFVYRESVQVPLIVKLPGGRRAGETVSAPAHLADVVPTVLDVVGLEAPPSAAGRSLLATAPAERFLYAESYYPRLYFGWSELRSVIGERFHYIHSPQPELFDLLTDPGERVDLVEAERPVATRLKEALDAIPAAFERPGDVDEETRLRLASLGYVGLLESQTDGPLPAPRSQAELLPRLEGAVQAQRAGRHGEAIEAFQAILAANPRMTLVWPMLALSLEEAGRTEEALAAYEESLTGSDRSPRLALAAARLALELGEARRAERWADLAAPAFPTAHELVAQLALRRGDRAKAERAAQAALSADPGSHAAALVLAQIRAAQGHSDEALELLDRAAASGGTARGVELVRGTVLARAGREEEAIAAFEREIARFPTDTRAYLELLSLRVSRGEVEAITPLLRRMVEGNGTARGWAAAVSALRDLGDAETAATLLREARRRFPASALLADLASGDPSRDSSTDGG